MKSPANTIHTRLLLLLAAIAALSILGLFGLHLLQERQIAAVQSARDQEFRGQFDRLLALHSATLAAFSSDYSYWDEMVSFVGSGDRDWAAINIDAALPPANAYAAWIFDPQLALVYGTDVANGAEKPLPPPLTADEFRELLRRQPFAHFYANSPVGLLEVRTAPIQPSADSARVTEARGYLVAARRWDASHLGSIGESADSRVVLAPAAAATDRPEARDAVRGRLRLDLTLPGWNGKPVARLEVYGTSLATSIWHSQLRQQLMAYAVMCTIMLVLLRLALTRWVESPLRALSRSLEAGDEQALVRLEASNTEFSGISRLLRDHLMQRRELERENAERRQLQSELLRLANSDPLTGLANRRVFRDRLGRQLQSAGGAGAGVGVLYADLDLFKAINDNHGHEIGDRFLQVIAERLQNCARSNDIVARFGGDEFLICVDSVSDRSEVEQVARRMLRVLAEPVRINALEIRPSASMGISYFPDHGQDADTLIVRADEAMYRAKQGGRNRYTVFDFASAN
ncbi:MAG: diguanylate cyclase [Gammaproteobacteria bacterium]